MKYEKCKIFMLPTTDKIGSIHKAPETGNLYFGTCSSTYKHYHLYITSCDDIMKSDVCIDIQERILFNAISDFRYLSTGTYRKIIATTNNSLNLPRPSNDFVRKYCESNGKISDILVKYVTDFSCIHFNKVGACRPDCFESCEVFRKTISVPFTAKDNTITILPEKTSWTKNEVIKIVHRYRKYMALRGNCNGKDCDKWLSENLYN